MIQKKDAEKTTAVNNEIQLRLKAEMNEKWAIGRHKGSKARGFINSKNLILYLFFVLLLLYFIFK